MPMTMILSFLKSKLGKYIVAGLIIAGIVTYYKVEIWNLGRQITNYISTIEVLENDNKILKDNLNNVIEVNKGQVQTLEKYKEEINNLNENYEVVLKGKVKEIERLKLLLKDATKPVTYKKVIEVKDCKIQVKDKPDETDITYNSINSIGF